MPITAFLESSLLSHVLRGNVVGAQYSQPALWCALLNTLPDPDPFDGLTETEVSGPGYGRKRVFFSAPDASGKSVNSTQVLFGPATGNWTTAVGIGIYDAQTTGRLLYWTPLSTGSATIIAGRTLVVPQGLLTIDLDTNPSFTDTQAPSVTISTPPDNSPVSGIFTLSGQVTDNVGVSSLTYKVDGGATQAVTFTETFRTATQVVYDWTKQVDSTALTNSLHVFTMTAQDAAGNSTSQSRGLNVDNTVVFNPPTVTIQSPVAGFPASGNLTVSGVATSDPRLSVTQVEVQLGTQPFQPAQLAAGPAPPTITITSPTNGTQVAAIITVSGTLTKDPTRTVSGVTVKLGTASAVNATVSGSAWNASIDTTSVSDGSSIPILVTITDSAGQTDTDQVSVNVKNTVAALPTIAITTPTVGQQISSAAFAVSGTLTKDATRTITSVVAKLGAGANTTMSFTNTTWNGTINTTAVTDGANIPFTVTITDSSGATATATRNVTVQNAVPIPTVSITTPTANQIIAGTAFPVSGGFTKDASRSVTSITLQLGTAAPVGMTVGASTWSGNLNTTLVNDSTSIPLVARITDSGGATNSATINVQVRNSQPVDPTITITTPPAGGSVSSNPFTVTGTATKDSTRTYTSITVKIGSAAQVSVSSPGNSWSVSAPVPADGSNIPVVATVTDSAGRTATDTNNVTVAVSTQGTVIALAGDIGSETGSGGQTTTGNIIRNDTSIQRIYAVGDLAYPNGTSGDFSSNYNPYWGSFKSITWPVVGNHEYKDTAGGGPAAGYKGYWGQAKAFPNGSTAFYYTHEHVPADWRVEDTHRDNDAPRSCGARKRYSRVVGYAPGERVGRIKVDYGALITTTRSLGTCVIVGR